VVLTIVDAVFVGHTVPVDASEAEYFDACEYVIYARLAPMVS
jgi:hypothetical protein